MNDIESLQGRYVLMGTIVAPCDYLADSMPARTNLGWHLK